MMRARWFSSPLPALTACLLLLAVLLTPSPLPAQMRFQEGRHYVQVPTPQTSGTVPAGRIEVVEVFSYACGGCFQAQAMVEELAAGLPADAGMGYVHAGFNTGWSLYQQGHLTAQQLGIAERHHARLFTAIWETAQFPHFDRATGQLRRPAPQIGDLARFYATAGGVSEADFLKKAASADIKTAVARSDALIRGWQVGSTPSFVVAGRYRIQNDAIGSTDDLKALVNYLVGLERNRLRSAQQKD